MLTKDSHAISPVIGVILMAAITVVLAATIAMFSFNFNSGLPNYNNVMIQVERVNSTCILIKNVGSSDQRHILFDPPGMPNGQSGEDATGFYGAFNVTVNDVEISNHVHHGAPSCTSDIGSLQYFSPVTPNSKVTVIANYKDSSKFVVWEGFV
ncbi:MAG: hypothetical protein A4E28_02169 [Methanocella sp. PtaU1.Bin125]|nr:MAG: hypothetical protein A4E28_02169 [Methanocella sp. PtaU1.Bin125]